MPFLTGISLMLLRLSGGPRGEIAGLPGGIGAAYREPGGQPGPVAAVEYPDVLVSVVTQQPPGAGGGRGVPVVVHDHGTVLAHPGRAHRLLEGHRIRQRVPAGGAGGRGQVAVQVDENRPWQVTLAVDVQAPGGRRGATARPAGAVLRR
jgi:hypothetical protein